MVTDINPPRPPDLWFNEAREIGLGVRLELNAILTALDGLRHVPGDFYVSVNVSPQTIVSGEIAGLSFMVELSALTGRDKLDEFDIHTLLTY